MGIDNVGRSLYVGVADTILTKNPTLMREVMRYASNRKATYSRWTADGAIYVNREKLKQYEPHHEAEAGFVGDDRPRYTLAKGSEGSGKSVAGIVKTLERLRRGMSGIMGSPDFEHMKKSLWPEFQRWCPPEALSPNQRHRLSPEWTPRSPFQLVFHTPDGRTATLLCGGFDDPSSWEGPNVSFAHWDEARRARTAAALKVLDGRCRIPGPQGEPPQVFITTTPRKHWMYEYFVGPLEPGAPDLYEDFRRDSKVITLLLEDNEANLSEGFVQQRRQSLTEQEARILIDADWEDEENSERFLASMLWWDSCQEALPPLGRREPMILAVDAATGRLNARSDCFALVGITRHPERSRRRDCVAVRYTNLWQAAPGRQIDFRGTTWDPGPETEIRRLCKEFRVVQLVYDPTQLVDMMQRLVSDGVVWCEPFGQGVSRNECDRRLLELITERRLAHVGDPALRQHIDNADRKVDLYESKLRIVKGRGHIDLAVALAMGSHACLELNL